MRSTEASRSEPATTAVLVCTRNRPDDLARLIRSLLADLAEGCEILVVDQSDAPMTDPVAADLLESPRVRYIRSQTSGKGAAMNEGMKSTLATYVVCTDDDCEAIPGWVSGMAAALHDRPRVAVVFCRVEAPPYDTTNGYVPEYRPRSDLQIRRALTSCAHRGLGAGMAIRRDAVMLYSGIDESFGPGARFGSGDDWDLQVRMLMKGWETFETDQLSIIHHGYRTFAQGRAHTQRDWISLGAAAAKPVRAGHPGLLLMAFYIVGVDCLLPMGRDLLRLRRPQGATRLISFGRGFLQGMRTSVDRSTLRYKRITKP